MAPFPRTCSLVSRARSNADTVVLKAHLSQEAEAAAAGGGHAARAALLEGRGESTESLAGHGARGRPQIKAFSRKLS